MIFFFGCSRTASKAYQYILNEYTQVNIARELHLISGITKKSLYRVYYKYKFQHKNIEKLCAELGTLRSATYWKTKQFDAEVFKYYLENKEIKKLNFKALILNIIEFDAHKNKKEIIGAKFLVHIFFYPPFKRLWGFNQAKYIFLVRKSKDILFSPFNKHEMKNRSTRMAMVFYVAFMFNFTFFIA